jgi:hypothetical protein
MNKEQQELLDDAYKNYLNRIDDKFREEDAKMDSFRNAMNNAKIDYTVKEFINKCKNDKDFSEKWGLKVEERELSLEERQNLYFKLNPEFRLVHEDMDKHMDKHNIPTKLITITYNDKTTESYE